MVSGMPVHLLLHLAEEFFAHQYCVALVEGFSVHGDGLVLAEDFFSLRDCVEMAEGFCAPR